MPLSDSFFGQKFGITEHDLESYLSEALSAGGEYADLYAGYEAAGGSPVNRETAAWWEMFGTLRWGVISS